MISLPGLGGGLDVQSIVSQVLFAERAPVRSLQQNESKVKSQSAAYRELKSKLLALDSAATTLAKNDVASAKAVSSSDTTILTATAKGNAVVGNYSVVVSTLATTDTYASSGFSSETASILTGSFDLQVGSDTAVTITVDSSNNTLTGLRDAINNSGADVTASILRDGSSYKLAIISKASGTDEAITLSNFTNPSQQTELNLARSVTLQDASITVNGISLTNGSNTFEDAIQGVTLNLVKAGSSQISVTPDTTVITDAINEFIDAYNAINSFFKSQFTYNAATQKAGVLAGDGTLQRIQRNLQSTLAGSITGLSTNLTNLREVGITFGNDGSLSLDSTKLNDALADNSTAVSNLFLTSARFTDSRATLVATNQKTQAGSYAIQITTAAEAATITGTGVVDPVDGLSAGGTLTVTYGGVEHGIALTQGQTISDIVSTVNSTLETAGVRVRASDSSGKLQIATQGYGSAESVSVRASASISSDLGISTTDETDSGVDVAGSINGTTASGNGQTLLAATGTNEEGLALSITATTAQVGGGLSLGTVTVSLGFAVLVDRITTDATRSSTGVLDTALTGLDKRVRDIRESISSIEARLLNRERQLTDQLTRADNALREMAEKISALNSQLAGIR